MVSLRRGDLSRYMSDIVRLRCPASSRRRTRSSVLSTRGARFHSAGGGGNRVLEIGHPSRGRLSSADILISDGIVIGRSSANCRRNGRTLCPTSLDSIDRVPPTATSVVPEPDRDSGPGDGRRRSGPYGSTGRCYSCSIARVRKSGSELPWSGSVFFSAPLDL